MKRIFVRLSVCALATLFAALAVPAQQEKQKKQAPQTSSQAATSQAGSSSSAQTPQSAAAQAAADTPPPSVSSGGSVSAGAARQASAALLAEKPKRGPVFRATKVQITEAQTLLKTKGLYAGEATGKLDDATREGLRRYQSESGIKVTGTLNRVTLEKMGITLTDKQLSAAAAAAAK